MSILPAIKWSGSKRSQAKEILSYFPKHIDTYYEPFIGGGSVLMALLNNSSITCKHYVCSDINADLIALYQAIMKDSLALAESYSEFWHELNDKDDDKDRKREYFYKIRERYNKEHKPEDFLFILRTTTNGMPRYNAKGEFNNSFHITRNGINPTELHNILQVWQDILNSYEVEFKCCDYKVINPKQADFLYADPPYANTKGMYFGGIDKEDFYDWLRKIDCSYCFSYDGISGKEDNTEEVPKDLFDKHLYLKSGNSSFRRVIGKSKDAIVYESLYLKEKRERLWHW